MSLKPKILIVDDNISNILVIEEVLSDLDVELIRAKSGQEAIEHTKNHEFALVLMDVQMPGMDGFETVEIIRQDKKIFYCLSFISRLFTMRIITAPKV